MKISKSFKVEKWDKETKKRVLSFWKDRGFSINKMLENTFEGKRGTIIGNIFSYDMSKIITKIKIKYIDGEIRCEYNIKKFGQIITKWNKKYWDLEVETFESVLFKENHMELEWKDYNKIARKRNILWSIFFSF